MQKIRERFCSRADNRTEVIGEKRREDDTFGEGGWRSLSADYEEEPAVKRRRLLLLLLLLVRGHGLEGAVESVERARKRGGGNLGFKYFAL